MCPAALYDTTTGMWLNSELPHLAVAAAATTIIFLYRQLEENSYLIEFTYSHRLGFQVSDGNDLKLKLFGLSCRPVRWPCVCNPSGTEPAAEKCRRCGWDSILRHVSWILTH